MSYSRWSDSNWYAFRTGPAGEPEKLALFHCSGEPDQREVWTYEQLDGVDEQWLRERYKDISDEDVLKAIQIIDLFRLEWEEREVRKRFGRLADKVRSDPCPENVEVILDMFISDPKESSISGDLLDFLFSLPASIWEARFLEKLEVIDVETFLEKQDNFLLLLKHVGKFLYRHRFLAILKAWADELSRWITAGQVPTSAAISPEEKLLRAIFGGLMSPENALEEMREALLKFGPDAR